MEDEARSRGDVDTATVIAHFRRHQRDFLGSQARRSAETLFFKDISARSLAFAPELVALAREVGLLDGPDGGLDDDPIAAAVVDAEPEPEWSRAALRDLEVRLAAAHPGLSPERLVARVWQARPRLHRQNHGKSEELGAFVGRVVETLESDGGGGEGSAITVLGRSEQSMRLATPTGPVYIAGSARATATGRPAWPTVFHHENIRRGCLLNSKATKSRMESGWLNAGGTECPATTAIDLIRDALGTLAVDRRTVPECPHCAAGLGRTSR